MRGPEYCRAVQQDKTTGSLKAREVVQLPNPGSIYEFHGQFYVIKNGLLKLCSPEEVKKAVKEEVALSKRQEEAKRQEKKFIEERARALGWNI